MAERVLIGIYLLGLGVEAWKGAGKTSGTVLPHPSLFTAWTVVMVVLALLAVVWPAVAAVIAVGILVALLLGADQLVNKAPAKAAA